MPAAVATANSPLSLMSDGDGDGGSDYFSSLGEAVKVKTVAQEDY